MARHFFSCTIALVLPFALAALALAAGAKAEVTVINHEGWSESLRVSNGEVDLVVVPAVGRIMLYGWVDGENLLWQHPHRAGHTGLTREGTWANVGGDKIWPWPDTSWPAASGVTLRDVDPPTEWEHAPHAAEITGPFSVRMTSSVWPARGLRVLRDITLAERGTRVTLTTRFERVASPAVEPAVATVPWSVTQLPPPSAILVDYVPGSPRPYGLLLGASWDSAFDIDRHTLWLPSPGGASKIGATGRKLGWWLGGVLLVQRLVSDAPDSGWEPYEQAQIFWSESPGEGASPYTELEFTAPRRPGAAPDPALGGALTVTWELHRLRSKRPTMDEVVATFRTASPAP